MSFDLDNSWSARARQTSLRQLRRIPLVEDLLHVERLIERGRYIDQLPRVASPLERHFDPFVRHGLVKTRIDAIGVPCEATLAATEDHLEGLRAGRGEPLGKTSLHVPLDELLETPEPYIFGLAAPILDFVERYFGLPVDYLGLDMKRELANGLEDGVRLWHFDVEDERMVKLIVYLDEVDESAGPFEAIDAGVSDRFRREAKYVWGDHYTSPEVERLVPRSEWYRGTGERHSLHIIDPVHILHRAGPPVSKDRYSMTFSYASKSSYFAFKTARISQAAFYKKWGSLLDDRQRRAVT